MGAVTEAPDWVEGALSFLPPPLVPRTWRQECQAGSSAGQILFPSSQSYRALGVFAKMEIIFLNIGLITSLFCSRLIKVPLEGLIELKCL